MFKENEKDHYCFVYLPGADPFNMTITDFDTSIKDGTLEFVEQLPCDVYNETLLMAKKAEATSRQNIRNFKIE